MLTLMLLALGGIVVRLAFLQVRDNPELEALGMQQRVRTVTLPARRGEILDRFGVPLAVTREARDIYVDPRYVVDARSEAGTIADVLDLREREVRATLESDGTFAYVDRQVDLEVADRLDALGLPGIGFLEVPKRYYPAGALAPQVLGFVNVDGAGAAGLESAYDDILAGTPGERTAELSADGLPISSGLDTVVEPVPGSTMHTTLDRQMQYMVQAALERAVRSNGALGGTAVVMDPITREVLAMATFPGFDPNAYSDAPIDAMRNRAVTDAFEPGSVNKIITAAAALETGAVSLDERFRVASSMKVGPFTIRDSHEHPIESMTIGDIITESSNIGAAMIAEQVGSVTLGSFMERFGYGRPTGVGFPGEAAGALLPGDQWDEVIRATVSYGQGISVTPLQMANVYATIADRGLWMQPTIVRGFERPDGTFDEAEVRRTRRVVRPDTAQLLTSMLASAVQEGTGVNAQIPGYQVAGKTGTSRKLDDNGHYVQRYHASFAGFLPAADPRVVIAVSIDEPRTVYGGLAAAPLFQEIARYAIQRLAIPAAPPVAFTPRAQGSS
ncbi:MAG: penicillin-binding protein 2 [Actinomycetota bacterium]|nr:penicillin-binding protein 2 [Actinomycetota bacterium]MDH5224288.1 penicillin-binding protein 2 [Actinomycetota bacterium]MDH5313025.1 penicillin-binding protein 2 [Actinomycetota bacterium]